MQPCASLIESFTTATASQTESLKIFFLVLQVTYFLQCGQMKSVKNTLKSLQHYVQSFVCRPDSEHEAKDPMDQFHWLHKDHLGILVYLLTVINAMQTGCFEKAQKFSEKALLNIQRLKLKEQEAAGLSFKQLVPLGKSSLTSYYSEYVTSSLHFMFLENVIRVNICMGNRCTAIKHIGDAFQLCQRDSRLMNSYAPQLHCLVGLYALSMNLKEQVTRANKDFFRFSLGTQVKYWFFVCCRRFLTSTNLWIAPMKLIFGYIMPWTRPHATWSRSKWILATKISSWI